MKCSVRVVAWKSGFKNSRKSIQMRAETKWKSMREKGIERNDTFFRVLLWLARVMLNVFPLLFISYCVTNNQNLFGLWRKWKWEKLQEEKSYWNLKYGICFHCDLLVFWIMLNTFCHFASPVNPHPFASTLQACFSTATVQK